MANSRVHWMRQIFKLEKELEKAKAESREPNPEDKKKLRALRKRLKRLDIVEESRKRLEMRIRREE